MSKRVIYCLSGLGADERIFKRFILNGYSLVHLPWLTPEKEESPSSYAGRLWHLIPEREPILLGVSFGGMMAREMALQRTVKTLILISTVIRREELTPLARIAGPLRLVHWLPMPLLIQINLLSAAWFFSLEEREDIILLRQIILDTNPIFLRWALRQITEWRFSLNQPLEPVIRIHGRGDRVLPLSRKENVQWIDKVGHWMIYTHAKQVESCLLACLPTCQESE